MAEIRMDGPGEYQSGVHTLTTVEDVKSPRVPRKVMLQSASASAPTASASLLEDADSTMVSPYEALRADEIARSVGLASMGLATALAVALCAAFLPWDPLANRVVLIGAAVLMVSNSMLLWLARRPNYYTEARVTTSWLLGSVGLLHVVYAFGAFSAVVAGMGIAVYFVSLGNSRRIALSTFALYVVGHLVMALLIIAGTIRDPGLISSAGVEDRFLWVGLLLIQAMLLSIYLLARMSRRTMLASVQKLHDAVRALAQRDILFEEARADFERALRIGGIGRFTGTDLGSFHLGDILGRGGVGEVYEAVHRQSGIPAAVKVLLIEAVARPQSLARFRREAELVSALDSPHVIRVYEVGGEDARVPYIAMERLKGEDLGSILRACPTLPIDEIATLVEQVGLGLEQASSAGIVHRDIKPQNLFRCADGTWKILDFGVSKLDSSSGSLTKGFVVGTPVYMAPEQAEGKNVDFRADLYALGAVAYRCVTGRRPFLSGELAAVLYEVIHQMPVQPSKLAACSEDMDLVFAIALAKDPTHRFDSSATLARALVDASNSALSPELRARGALQLKRFPWFREFYL